MVCDENKKLENGSRFEGEDRRSGALAARVSIKEGYDLIVFCCCNKSVLVRGNKGLDLPKNAFKKREKGAMTHYSARYEGS